jgi:hypothetical protein
MDDNNLSLTKNDVDTRIKSDTIKNKKTKPFEAPKKFK